MKLHFMFCLFLTFPLISGRLHGYSKFLLSNVDKLIFQNGKMTTGRRSSPIEQLQCDPSGSAGCPAEAKLESAMCENIGQSDTNDPIWKCTAELGENYAFSNTDVSCEGWDSPEDPYILAGSCALVYKLKWASGAEGQTSRMDNSFLGPSSSSEGSGVAVYIILVAIVLFVICNKKFKAASVGPTEPVVAVPVDPGAEEWEQRFDDQGRAYYVNTSCAIDSDNGSAQQQSNTANAGWNGDGGVAVDPQTGSAQQQSNTQNANWNNSGMGGNGTPFNNGRFSRTRGGEGIGMGGAGNLLLGMALGRRLGLGGMGGMGRVMRAGRRFSSNNNGWGSANSQSWQRTFNGNNMRPDPFGGNSRFSHQPARPSMARTARAPRAARPSSGPVKTRFASSFARTTNR